MGWQHLRPRFDPDELRAPVPQDRRGGVRGAEIYAETK